MHGSVWAGVRHKKPNLGRGSDSLPTMTSHTPRASGRIVHIDGLRGIAIAPSAKVAFYLAAAVVWHLWPRRTSSRVRAVLLGAGALSVTWFLYDSIANRLSGQVGLSETGSFYGRILIGPRVALEALSQHPLMGYGIGNKEGLRPLVVQEWTSSGAFSRFPWFQGLDTSALMTNGFWWQWSFLGLLGGGIFIALMVKMLTAVGVALPWRTIVCTWIVWYSGAAFTDPASWCAFAAFAIPAWYDRGRNASADDDGLPRRRSRVDGACGDVAQTDLHRVGSRHERRRLQSRL